MSFRPLIRVESVRKKFCRSLNKSMVYGALDILSESFGRLPPPSLRVGEFWALDNVSFEAEPGECFGIIGANGSGKSTLLKLINGTIMPDAGRITVRGRVGALIEIGAGFHPLLSGRENIFLSAATHGMPLSRLRKKLDAIIDFSELGEFIDTPVKHYSTGMYMRLGFSVAAFLDSHILLIDEAFAVGDTAFRLKCFRYVSALTNNGAVILLVTHNLAEIYRLCSRVLVLDQGHPFFSGDVHTAISRYQELSLKLSNKPSSNDGQIQILSAVPIAEGGFPCFSFPTSRLLGLQFTYESSLSLSNSTIIIKLVNSEVGPFVSFTNHVTGTAIPLRRGNGTIQVFLHNLDLLSGSYCFEIHLYDSLRTTFFSKLTPACCFRIESPIPDVWKDFHLLRASHHWNIHPTCLPE